METGYVRSSTAVDFSSKIVNFVIFWVKLRDWLPTLHLPLLLELRSLRVFDTPGGMFSQENWCVQLESQDIYMDDERSENVVKT